MDKSLFVEQLQSLAATSIQEALLENRISLEKAGELSDLVLKYLYPSINKDHLLLAREAFIKQPELKYLSEEIDSHINELT